MDEETDKAPQQEPAKADKVEAPKPAGAANTNAALTYLAGWITGLIFLLTEKDDEFVRFHAAQSLVTFGALNIIMLIPGINVLLGLLVGPLSLVLWVLLMYKAYNNELFKLPLAGDFADQLKDKIGK